MHDIHDVRALGVPSFDMALTQRGFDAAGEALLDLDSRWKQVLSTLQTLQTERNQLAKQIGVAKRNGFETVELEAQGSSIRQQIDTLTAKVDDIETALQQRLAALPNILEPDVPDGRDQSHNVLIKSWGHIRTFDTAPRHHFEIGEALNLMDFASASKIAGSRFTVLRGPLARLERALGQFMIDLHTQEHGYTEISPPLLVNDAAVFGTAQLPKFADDLFRTTDGRWLIPTAEVPLTNLVADEIVDVAKLPIRITALTPCFRSEAGAAGRDARGMLRQHQFSKVELVSITPPQMSADEHERMTRCAETVLERLQLPYRRMLLCAGDTGFSSAKTYDLEVWLPGQGIYREISSCSNCRTFQARRMNARYRPAQVGTKPAKPEFVHTLNGSGVAVGRALIALMENYQNADGSIAIPDVLRPYMGGMTTVG